MKNISRNLLLCALLIAGLPPLSHAEANRPCHEPAEKKHDRSGISGIIGQIVELPGPWHIRILKEKKKDDKLIADIQADLDGSFEVDLKPGTYILTPYFPSLEGSGVLLGASTTVVVEKKEFTIVVLPIVNGPS